MLHASILHSEEKLDANLPLGRKFLRFSILKSKFFKDFSQKSAYMYMSAHTLQGPVPTVDLRTPEENATTQHNVYTLATERYHFEPYLWCIDRCYGTPKTNIFVLDFNILKI